MASARAGSGLARRMLVASCLLSVIVVGTFAVLFATIVSLRDSANRASHSETVMSSANRLERLVVDMETAQRGFVITGDGRYLQPWNAARAAFPGEVADLRRYAAASGASGAAEIARQSASFVNDYSVPLVTAAQRNPASVRTYPKVEEGERRLADLRTRFDRFLVAQREIAAAQAANADAAATRAVIVTAASTAAWLLLILLAWGYLTRVIVRPVRRAAGMADELAGGDLAVRVPETSPVEVGVLERAFNTMAGSLEANRAAIRRYADEQQALRRVATLVACGVPPEEVFGAVTRELGRLLGVGYAGTVRFEPDDTLTVVGAWGAEAPPISVGSRWSLAGDSLSSRVRRTGRPTRIAYYDSIDSELGGWTYAQGFRSAAASPIIVEQRLWGAMLALTMSDEPLPVDTEARMQEFTELIGTAIANTESREALRASRARVVTTADETRRRIERNLHDSTQQHLISLALQLRAIEEIIPAGQARELLAAASRRLTEIVEELQEISRGLHPAILSRAGLGPALKALCRRSVLPIELDLDLPGRLPEPVEVAVYYTVSEAVTNAAKHANASAVRVAVDVRDGTVCLTVNDDGVGGAGYGDGTGLVGIRDRVEALGGHLTLTSGAGEGTSLRAEIPA